MGMTVIQVADSVRTEGDAYRFMEQLRWGDGSPSCLHCDSADTVLITPKNGHYRFSTRKMSDTARMERLMGQVGGKRLTYKLVSA